MLRRLALIFLLIVMVAGAARGAVDVGKYGLSKDSITISGVKAAVDSMVLKPFAGHVVIYKIEPLRVYRDRTPDFYLLLTLCAILGLIRYTNPRYFGMLIRAFRNPNGSRGLKEGIQGDVLSNLLMNLLFGAVAGTYLFYLARTFGNPVSKWVRYGNPELLAACIGGMLGIYLVKYLVIRFSGWAFRVTTITDQYIFNVFLINKVIGILLLPFLVLIAFADISWAYSLVFISLIAVGLLEINRYMRSWPVFSSFFQHSRFHFFTYLCASEILPMAIIVKLLLRVAS